MRGFVNRTGFSKCPRFQDEGAQVTRIVHSHGAPHSHDNAKTTTAGHQSIGQQHSMRSDPKIRAFAGHDRLLVGAFTRMTNGELETQKPLSEFMKQLNDTVWTWDSVERVEDLGHQKL